MNGNADYICKGTHMYSYGGYVTRKTTIWCKGTFIKYFLVSFVIKRRLYFFVCILLEFFSRLHTPLVDRINLTEPETSNSIV